MSPNEEDPDSSWLEKTNDESSELWSPEVEWDARDMEEVDAGEKDRGAKPNSEK